MKQKDIDKINSYFEKWKGTEAFFNRYTDENDCLVLGMVKVDDPQNPVGVSLFYVAYIEGPPRWSNCEMKCASFDFEDGETGFEITDLNAGVTIRCYGPIRLGETGEVIPE